MRRNRWGIAASAVGIHICIGSVYAWSVLTKPIMNLMGLSLKETSWTFSLAILFLGLSAAFFGSFVEKRGPRASGLLSAACFVGGMLGTAYAFSVGSMWLMYLFYGFVGGLGLGIGYITPVSTLVKWFPARRGFATGLAIMGFGFAALIAGPVMQTLNVAFGLSTTFVILAAVYGIVMVSSALYLRAPHEGEVEAPHMAPAMTDRGPIMVAKVIHQFTAKEALHNWRFYAMWWMLFTNITCGIGLLSVASPMAQEVVGMTAGQAASMVGIIGLLNGAGRIAWASVSDFLGRGNTYILFFVIQIVAFVALAQTADAFMFQGLVFLIITCYGGGFATIPAYISDLFGTKSLSNIHGKVLTAWAAAGIIGPLAISWVRETTSGFNTTLYIFSASFVIALIVAIILRMRGQREQYIEGAKLNHEEEENGQTQRDSFVEEVKA